MAAPDHLVCRTEHGPECRLVALVEALPEEVDNPPQPHQSAVVDATLRQRTFVIAGQGGNRRVQFRQRPIEERVRRLQLRPMQPLAVRAPSMLMPGVEFPPQAVPLGFGLPDAGHGRTSRPHPCEQRT
jgi:hypothetical protein